MQIWGAGRQVQEEAELRDDDPARLEGKVAGSARLQLLCSSEQAQKLVSESMLILAVTGLAVNSALPPLCSVKK